LPLPLCLPDGVWVQHPRIQSTKSMASQVEVFVSSDFSASELSQFWSRFHRDDACIGKYVDPLPRSLETFLDKTATGQMHFCLIYYRGQVAGASWLHDLSTYQGSPTAWMALYHLPEFRSTSHLGVRDQQGMFVWASQLGIYSIFAACRRTNLVAKKSIAKSGFEWVAEVPKFAQWDGEWDAAHVHTLRPEDTAECERQAYLRADKNRFLASFDYPAATLSS